jgi:hypothetical protein
MRSALKYGTLADAEEEKLAADISIDTANRRELDQGTNMVFGAVIRGELSVLE